MNELKTMHIFAGHGGGLLADLILGHKPVVAVEWDGYACQVLRERAADGWFPGLRVWEGDVRLFDPSEYAGSVDVIHAGFPCQDISVAGKQAGVSEGTRSGLYREVLRIAGVVRPRFLFLENVAAILSNGLGTVLADLAAMGYDCRWLCIRASDVGAPHHRDRWFLLAYANDAECKTRCGDGLGKSEPAKAFARDCVNVADTNGARQQQSNKEMAHRSSEQFDCCCIQSAQDVPNTNDTRSQRGLQDRSIDSQGRKKSGVRCVTERSAEWDGRGDSFWATEPGLGRVANGIPNRVGQLKGYGNAQVPLQAAVAWRLLGGEQ